MKGKEIGSLINMVSKSKPMLPLLFAAGGLNRLTAVNLVPEGECNGTGSGDDSCAQQAAEEKFKNSWCQNEDSNTQAPPDFDSIKIETDQTQKPFVEIQCWGTWNGRDNAAFAKKLVLHSYPNAKFDIVEDNNKSGNLIIKVGDKICFDRIDYQKEPQHSLTK